MIIKSMVYYEQVWFMSDDILAYEYGMTLRSVLVMTQAGSQVSGEIAVSV